MASRQFSFFLGFNDQASIEQAIRKSGDVVFFRESAPSPSPVQVRTVVIEQHRPEPFKILICRRVDLTSIQFIESPGPHGYYVDQDRSPFVEFSRFPKMADDHQIRASRLYRIDKYWNDVDKLVSKSLDFVEWAEHLYALTKASMIKIQNGYYAGAEAIKLRRDGILFEGI